jgi:hypothetical protein
MTSIIDIYRIAAIIFCEKNITCLTLDNYHALYSIGSSFLESLFWEGKGGSTVSHGF